MLRLHCKNNEWNSVRPSDGRSDGRTGGRTDGRTDGRTEGRAGGRTDGRSGGRTGGRTHGRTNGCTDGRSGARTTRRTGGMAVVHMISSWRRPAPLALENIHRVLTQRELPSLWLKYRTWNLSIPLRLDLVTCSDCWRRQIKVGEYQQWSRCARIASESSHVD